MIIYIYTYHISYVICGGISGDLHQGIQNTIATEVVHCFKRPGLRFPSYLYDFSASKQRTCDRRISLNLILSLFLG